VVVSAGQGCTFHAICHSLLAFEFVSLRITFRLSMWFH
jgi:hypothetical protein